MLALGVFVAVGLVVSSVVDYAARHSKQAARATAESELLVTTAGSILRGQQALAAVLDRVREAFGMESVTLLECAQEPTGPRRPTADWTAVASSGEPALARPEQADVDVAVADSLVLALRGRPLPATDRRVLGAFAAYAAAALEQQRLTAEAAAARSGSTCGPAITRSPSRRTASRRWPRRRGTRRTSSSSTSGCRTWTAWR